MADDRTGSSSHRGSGSQASAEGSGAYTGTIADQAQKTMRGASEIASNMWDSASKQGTRYYRQGSRAIGKVDNGTLAGLFIAGAIGFVSSWLVFGQSREGRHVARGMSRSSERYR